MLVLFCRRERPRHGRSNQRGGLLRPKSGRLGGDTAGLERRGKVAGPGGKVPRREARVRRKNAEDVGRSTCASGSLHLAPETVLDGDTAAASAAAPAAAAAAMQALLVVVVLAVAWWRRDGGSRVVRTRIADSNGGGCASSVPPFTATAANANAAAGDGEHRGGWQELWLGVATRGTGLRVCVFECDRNCWPAPRREKIKKRRNQQQAGCGGRGGSVRKWTMLITSR